MREQGEWANRFAGPLGAASRTRGDRLRDARAIELK